MSSAMGSATNLSSVNSLISFLSSSSALSWCGCCIDVRMSRQSFAAFVLSICRTREPGNTLLSAGLSKLADARSSEERRRRGGRIMLEWRRVLRGQIDIPAAAAAGGGSSRDPSKALSSQSLSQHNLSTGIKPASKV